MTATCSVPPALVHARDRIDVSGLDEGAQWANWPQTLQRLGVADLVRTTDTPLWQWPLTSEMDGVDVKRLVASGVCLDDVTTWCRTWRGGEGEPTEVCGLMTTDITEMGFVWPDMTVRDAVGWMLLGGSFAHKVDPRDLACEWGSPPVPGTWRHAAAGMTRNEITRDEMTARVAAGTLDEQSVSTLAALRGAVLPAG